MALNDYLMLSLIFKMYPIDQDIRRDCTGNRLDRRTVPFLLCLCYFGVFFGYSLWVASFHNYAVETFHISALHVGYLFSAAALPGTFAFLIGMIARNFSLSTLMTFACGLMGTGLIGIGFAPSSNFLWPAVLSIGLGFTFFYPVINSIGIQHSDSRTISTAVGHLKSYGPLAAVSAFILIATCLPLVGYQCFFVVSGGFIVLIGFWALKDLPIKHCADRPGNLRFRKELWPYYVLNFLAGCRSAGIKAFVLLSLIWNHELLVHETAAILLISNLCSLIGFRLIGYFANRYNPLKVASFIYLAVSLIFLGFFFLNSRSLLILLFFFESLLFGVSVVTDSHLKSVCRSEDVIGNVASGFTLFHIGKTIFPFVGGILWIHFDQQATFLVVGILAGLAVWVSKKLIISPSDIP